MLTLDEMVDRLLTAAEPEELLELLDITNEELLLRFEDKLELRYKEVSAYVRDTFE